MKSAHSRGASVAQPCLRGQIWGAGVNHVTFSRENELELLEDSLAKLDN
jgi:hypothetical protein